MHQDFPRSDPAGEHSPKPLQGLLVVAVEQAVAAPLCSGRLAEMGARVIKVERESGDFARGYDRAVHGNSSYFTWNNRGKESLVLDFKRAEDARLLHRIVGQADVFIQNLAPGALERAGFGSEDLRKANPRLITCDITGYGDGPASGLKAYDLLVQCESGLVGISGSPEAYGRIGVSICDIGAGMNATIAVLSALASRNRTGKGCGVAVSLFGGAADWMTVPYLHEVYGQGAAGRQGLKHPSIAPYGAFTTADGDDMVISIQNEREWARFCEVFMGSGTLAADARFRSNNARVENRAQLDRTIGGRFAALPTQAARDLLAQAGTAYGQVRSVEEFSRHPALRTWPMPVGDQVIDAVAPAVLAPWDSGVFEAAPALGQHSASIRNEFKQKATAYE